MDNKDKLIVFNCSMVLTILFWRILVFLKNGEISILRAITGLNIHHHTYGTIILTISLLLYLFYKQNSIILSFLGFGVGSIFDGFFSRLFKSYTRAQEISTYNANFYNALILIVIIILISIIFYLMNKYKRDS